MLPTIPDADAYHEARQTQVWLAIGDDDTTKTAALTRADDYVRNTYTFIDGTLEDDAAILTAVTALAPTMLTEPSIGRDVPIVETEDHLAALYTRVKYGETPEDPYPFVSKLLRSIVQTRFGATSGTIRSVI